MFSRSTPVLAAVDTAGPDWQLTVDHAVAFARRGGVGVHLVHVLPSTPWLLRRVLADDAAEAYEAERAEAARAALAEAAQRVPDDVAVTTELRKGKPATEIIAAVHAVHASLLVVGVGKPSTKDLLIGGTADRLLRTSPVPILVRAGGPPRDPRRVLVATGLGPSGARAIEQAAALAAGHDDAVVEALHMVALPGVMRAYSGDVMKLREAMEAEARAQLQAHVDGLSLPEGAPAVTPVLHANRETTPAEATILARARETEADLICLALGGRALPGGSIIGKVADRVIRGLPCPLLGLPDRWVDGR